MEINIYRKIQNVKEELLKANLKKTGENKFAGFKYYELADFLPTIIQLCNKEGLATQVSFEEDYAKLRITNIDKPEEFIDYTSPMRRLDLKGCNEIQSLGGVETYSRRYLYQAAFDIIENDMFDKVSGDKEKEQIDYRNLLTEYCKKNNIEAVEIAKTYGLTSKSTQEAYKKVYEELNANK